LDGANVLTDGVPQADLILLVKALKVCVQSWFLECAYGIHVFFNFVFCCVFWVDMDFVEFETYVLLIGQYMLILSCKNWWLKMIWVTESLVPDCRCGCFMCLPQRQNHGLLNH
jgi:hypothetical protein